MNNSLEAKLTQLDFRVFGNTMLVGFLLKYDTGDDNRLTKGMKSIVWVTFVSRSLDGFGSDLRPINSNQCLTDLEQIQEEHAELEFTRKLPNFLKNFASASIVILSCLF